MSARPLVHSRWLRGLQAGFDRFAQPKGCVARVSNLLLTRRGAWKVCDGTALVTQYQSALQTNFGPITEVFLYQPTGGNAGYFGIVKEAADCLFFAFTAPFYTTAQIIKTLPADALPDPGSGGGLGGGGGSGGGGGGTGFNPPTPSGGVTGQLGPLPLIVQFVNKMMLALGNGLTPYTSDGTPGGTVQIANTFSATYPIWAASTVFNQGAQLQALVGGVKYVFTAAQGGVTGSGGSPAFPATLGATVVDNNIIWRNSGEVSTSPPPRGAAHAEVYAGSLWVANTGIVMSSDQLDGPSAIRMSDLNNPGSWNPLNAAQIAPDDGDQCTGIKAFTVAAAGIAPQNFLLYFKNFASYLIQGVFGASDFAITRLQTDLGCVAPRSIQFLPGFGIMRLSHLGFAVTDGINDKLQDPEAIRPYLFPESTESDITPIDQTYLYFAKAAQTANPPMYTCALPLQGSASSLLNGLTVGYAPEGASPVLDAGTYYMVIQVVAPGGVVYTSGELSLSMPAPTGHGHTITQGIVVTLPNAALSTSWRIYIGTVSGGELVYLPMLRTQSSITITNAVLAAQQLPGAPGLGMGGALSRVFCYDLILKSWTVVDLPFPISVFKQFRTPGSSPITIMAGFNDGALRRWQGGDPAWDAGALTAGGSQAVNWSFQDSEVYVDGGTSHLFHNQIIIRGDGGPSAISSVIQRNGKSRDTVAAALTALGQNQYEARLRVLRRAENLNLTLSGSGPATVESIAYDVVEKPAGAALIFS